jgi:pimeloyl-ACP methyl ester carboxylesterase
MNLSRRFSKLPGSDISTRDGNEVIVPVPGWAADGRIFAPLTFEHDCLLISSSSPRGFGDALYRELKRRKIDRISLFGWSLGGFLAADFAVLHPECVEEIFLLGVRRRYPEKDLKDMRRALGENRSGCLSGFYRACFSPADDGGEWFRRHLLGSYLREMSMEILLEGLDYLERAEIVPERLGGLRVIFIHGGKDRIAPVEEARALSEACENAEFREFEGAGHALFLNSSFPKEFYDRQKGD